MFDSVPRLPHPAEIAGSTTEKLRAIERQIAALIEERHRLRCLLLGDPFKIEERLSRLAKLAARAGRGRPAPPAPAGRPSSFTD